MSRAPNKNRDQAPPGRVMTFLPHEFAYLKYNYPPSGNPKDLGGYQKEENWLIDNTDRVTWDVVLDPVHLERVPRYCSNYGSGGPNARIRKACIPALRRIGIEVLPKFNKPKKE